LCKDWARMPSAAQVPGYTRYPPLFSFLSRGHFELWRNKSQRRALRDIERNCRMLEDVVRVWFIRAVKDVLPSEASVVEKQSSRLNPYAISLDSSKWESDGLFKGTSSGSTLIDKDIRYYCREIALSGAGLALHAARFYAWNNRIGAPETAALSDDFFEPVKFYGRANTLMDGWRTLRRTQKALS